MRSGATRTHIRTPIGGWPHKQWIYLLCHSEAPLHDLAKLMLHPWKVPWALPTLTVQSQIEMPHLACEFLGYQPEMNA